MFEKNVKGGLDVTRKMGLRMKRCLEELAKVGVFFNEKEKKINFLGTYSPS